ncbi:TPA: SHOCT domain-containing protein, partial [Staphylococcus aureus]
FFFFMEVIKIEDTKIRDYEITYTLKDLENEYDAFLSLSIVKNMFEQGLITSDEKLKITQKIIDQFTPYLSEIITQMT